MLTRASALLLTSLCLMTACDRLGLPDPAKEAATREADSRATGSACRHAGRGIEDCYALNPDASRAAVYAGWKDMNDYMRENKIEDVKPSIGSGGKPAAAEAASHSSASEAGSASASASAH